MKKDKNDTVFICQFCQLPFLSHKDDDSQICWKCLLKQIEDPPDPNKPL